jgi:copper chaperone NosL
MAYQPPLIGFKQLLNFGAYSIPDIGGWLFIGAGLLTLIAVAIEFGWLKKWIQPNTAMLLFTLLALSSCSSKNPEPLALNKDQCESCKMTYADIRFGAECITTKGKVYKFDDLSCMKAFSSSNNTMVIDRWYINDYNGNNVLIDATKAWYVLHETIKSPMNGNTAAFAQQHEAEKFAASFAGKISTWEEIN